MELARTNMGYYSDVVYAIKFDKDAAYVENTPDEEQTYSGKGMFQIFLTEAKANKDTEQCFRDDDGDFKIDNENLTITYTARGVKWYEGSFSDVDCHIHLLHLADEYIELHHKANMISSPINWGFARIGEENGDDETRHGGSWGYELVEISRSVNLNV
jgi:hypothetical protein